LRAYSANCRTRMLSTQEVERRKKSPAWAGLSISEERRTTAYAVRSTTRSLARPLRSLCNGDHRSALFTAELLRACSANCGASEWGKIGRTPPRTERRNPAPVAPRGGVLLLECYRQGPPGSWAGELCFNTALFLANGTRVARTGSRPVPQHGTRIRDWVPLSRR